MKTVYHWGESKGTDIWYPPRVFRDPAYAPNCNVREITITVRAAIGDERLSERVLPAVAEFCAAAIKDRAGFGSPEDYIASNGVAVRTETRVYAFDEVPNT